MITRPRRARPAGPLPGLRAGLAAGILAGIPAGLLAGVPVPATAEEAAPLYLRIRPPEARTPEPGAGGSDRDAAAEALAGTFADAEAIRRARAAREAVWERSNARARVLIASVCTGCMKPMPPAPVSAGPEPATAPRPAEPGPSGALAALVPDPAPHRSQAQEESP